MSEFLLHSINVNQGNKLIAVSLRMIANGRKNITGMSALQPNA